MLQSPMLQTLTHANAWTRGSGNRRRTTVARRLRTTQTDLGATLWTCAAQLTLPGPTATRTAAATARTRQPPSRQPPSQPRHLAPQLPMVQNNQPATASASSDGILTAARTLDAHSRQTT